MGAVPLASSAVRGEDAVDSLARGALGVNARLREKQAKGTLGLWWDEGVESGERSAESGCAVARVVVSEGWCARSAASRASSPCAR